MKDTVHADTDNSMNKPDSYKNQDQSSTQENTQDLDQHQNVDMSPSQLNFQNVQIVTDNNLNNYTGKIVGTTYLEKTKELVPNAKILLYFGSEAGFPVCKTKSDDTGSFIIEDLPPGYYTLHVYLDNTFQAKVPNIKVLPGQNIHQSITLKSSHEAYKNSYEDHKSSYESSVRVNTL